MALYKNANYVKSSTGSEFDSTHNPGANTPYSGIYRCEGCGKEIASNAGNPLPPQNHHQHSSTSVAIKWRLIVRTSS